MSDTNQPQPFTNAIPPFDERAALAELERLADKIQLSRQQREQKVAEFDAFVKGFRMDRYAASIAATDRERRRVEDRTAAAGAATHAGRAGAPAVEAVRPSATAPAAADASRVAPVDAPLEANAQPVAARLARPRAAYVSVGLAALAVVAVTVLLWRSAAGPVVPAADAPAAAQPSNPAAAAAIPPAVDPAPLPAPDPQRPLNVVFVTIRPVWARVTVDGRRAMERELPADQRLTFGADRTIAIRAGDAGAIRLFVDGKDQGVLGRDGQIFSSTYSAQPR